MDRQHQIFSAGGERRVAWLIERGQTVRHDPTIWWCGGDHRAEVGEDEMNNWTDDASLARKFNTKEQADALARQLFGPSLYDITEHVFINNPRPCGA